MRDTPYRLKGGDLVDVRGDVLRGLAIIHDGNRVLAHGGDDAVSRRASRLEAGAEDLPPGFDGTRLQLFRVPWARAGLLDTRDVEALCAAVTVPGALARLRGVSGAQWGVLALPEPEPGESW